MNTFRCITISVCLSALLGTAWAQQPVKPVLSAEPAGPAVSPALAPKISADAGPLSLSPNYVIGAEDSLKIEVWKEPQLSTTLTVRPDGKISLPLIDDIMAAGFTPMQLKDDIAARLSKFVTDPVVNVSVLQVNSKNVFMIGNVGHVGSIPIAPGMTILQAIASAGGLTPYANGKHIYILRGDPGKQQKVFFDYNKADVRSDEMPTTQNNSAFLSQHPNVKVVIEGHCDDRGSEEYNLALGTSRAESAKQALVQQGIAAERITTVSLGKEKPFCNQDNEQCWQQNRVDHFVFAR